MTLPYTATQAEDAMYINQQTIVTLEFHTYQTDCEYTVLERIDEQLEENKTGKRPEYKLGTHKYDEETMSSGRRIFAPL